MVFLTYQRGALHDLPDDPAAYDAVLERIAAQALDRITADGNLERPGCGDDIGDTSLGITSLPALAWQRSGGTATDGRLAKLTGAAGVNFADKGARLVADGPLSVGAVAVTSAGANSPSPPPTSPAPTARPTSTAPTPSASPRSRRPSASPPTPAATATPTPAGATSSPPPPSKPPPPPHPRTASPSWVSATAPPTPPTYPSRPTSPWAWTA
jgi:hypothetical protein